MNKKMLQEASAHAVEVYPQECCGVVLAVGRKKEYVRIDNVAEDPTMGFRMDEMQLLAAEERGTVVTIVHSHPGASSAPSNHDKSQCENSKLPWCILGVSTDPATPDEPPVVTSNTIITPVGYEMPYTGREFVFGVTDCYTLVQDFYLREFNIVLPSGNGRTDKFWERGENLYMDNFEEAGFSRIATPTQKGDVILMAIRSDIVNHAGIWLGEQDHMLHHPYNHLSERTVFGGYWAENTRLYVRRNDL